MHARLKPNERINMTKVAPLTKRKPIPIFVRLLGALLLVAMALHSAPAFANDVCTNADLQGAYVYSVDATAINFPPNGPVAILGKISLDGRGNFTVGPQWLCGRSNHRKTRRW
jgi:hypothetical protein